MFKALLLSRRLTPESSYLDCYVVARLCGGLRGEGGRKACTANVNHEHEPALFPQNVGDTNLPLTEQWRYQNDVWNVLQIMIETTNLFQATQIIKEIISSFTYGSCKLDHICIRFCFMVFQSSHSFNSAIRFLCTKYTCTLYVLQWRTFRGW